MIPNIITTIRLISIFPLSISIYLNGIYSIWQFIFFALIILTDFLDGYIARKYNMITKVGKLLDPVVDKVLVVCITLVLIIKNIIPIYSLFIFIRDIVILFMFGLYYIKKRKKVIGADKYGKVKTALHFLSLALVLIFNSWNIYSLILLILGLLTVFPETIYIYKTHLKES